MSYNNESGEGVQLYDGEPHDNDDEPPSDIEENADDLYNPPWAPK